MASNGPNMLLRETCRLPRVGPALLLGYTADCLEPPQHCSDVLPMNSNGPKVAPEKCCRWLQMGPILLLRERCRLPRMGPVLLLSYAADCLEWAPHCFSDILPTVSNGPSDTPLRGTADSLASLSTFLQWSAVR
jgi:hypothetical protein